jgi:serine protease
MASPHVAGVAALIKASGVKEPDAILQVLQQSVRSIKEDPLNYYGAGHLDAANAVQLALKGQFSFNDFFRWLRDNGYLNPVFWIDGGAVALLPKILSVVGSYLLAWVLRNYIPFGWSFSMISGLVAGSSGLFFLRGIYIFDLPQVPFRILGSSLPELGNAIAGNNLVNPLFASILIPVLLLILLWGNHSGKKFVIGLSLGMAVNLGIDAIHSPAMWLLGEGILSRGFLIINSLLCFGLAYLAMKSQAKLTSDY